MNEEVLSLQPMFPPKPLDTTLPLVEVDAQKVGLDAFRFFLNIECSSVACAYYLIISEFLYIIEQVVRRTLVPILLLHFCSLLIFISYYYIIFLSHIIQVASCPPPTAPDFFSPPPPGESDLLFCSSCY